MWSDTSQFEFDFFFIFCSARFEGSHGGLCVNFMPEFSIYNEFFIITFSHI
jgi:hypothetical protein